MPPTVAQFAKRVVESGLLSADELAAFERTAGHSHSATDVKEFARQLIRAGKLTSYQAEAVLQGKTRGLVIADYVVLERIGQGGMGVVFKARHRRMDRLVAVKVLPSNVANSKEAIQRFQREVRAAARLHHPHIVTAYDAGEAAGLHYLVMEYIEGENLAKIVRARGPQPVPAVLSWIMQAAEGLDYAHRQGVIHRDVKPSNLLLSNEDQIKILDMGLARIDLALGSGGTSEADRLTTAGQLMGTFDFMAPEQMEDLRSADQRADIYSLGCTLFQLLTARPPYEGRTPIQLLFAHRDAPIPELRALRPEVPEAVEAVFRTMVAKRPADRPRSMGEVLESLGRGVRSAVSRGSTAAVALPSEEATAEEALSIAPVVAVGESPVAAQEATEPVAHQETIGPRERLGLSRLPRPRTAWDWARGGIALVAFLVIAGTIWMVLRWPGSRSNALPEDVSRDVAQASPRSGPQDSVKVARLGSSAAASPEPAATSPPATPAAPPPSPASPPWEAAWNELEPRAGGLIRLRAFGAAIREYEALRTTPSDPLLESKIRAAVAAAEQQADLAYQELATQARSMLAAKRYSDARATIKPAIELFGIERLQGEARKIAAEIDAAELQQSLAVNPRPEPAEAAGAAPSELLTPEERYAEALRPVEELVFAWDFSGGLAALQALRFDDPTLQQQLATRGRQIQQMAALKSKLIALVNGAQPPLKKFDLAIPGVNGQLVRADESGITARLTGDRSEMIAWRMLGPKSLPKMLSRVVDDSQADEWLAAGCLAMTCHDASLAERCLRQAAALGGNIDPHVGLLAATALSQADDHLARQEFATAEQILTSIQASFGTTSWFRARASSWEQRLKTIVARKREAEASGLYQEAVDKYRNGALFDLAPLVQRLQTEFPDPPALQGTGDQPSLAEMQQAIAGLGRRLVVRKTGKGDFATIQAAIDNAPPRSLIEIYDSGTYQERLTFPRDRHGITVRGRPGTLPLIVSPSPNDLALVAIDAAGSRLENVAIVHTAAPDSSFSCVAVYGGSLKMHSVLAYMDRSAEAFLVRPEGSAEVADSLILATVAARGGLVFNNCLLLGSHGRPTVGSTVNLYFTSELRSCTILGGCELWVSPNRILDCAIDQVVRGTLEDRLENCDIFGNPPFNASQAKPGPGCFAGDPRFRDRANLDYRVLVGSPCAGRASDGGDVGCRFTPQITELCRKAGELRLKGLVKF